MVALFREGSMDLFCNQKMNILFSKYEENRIKKEEIAMLFQHSKKCEKCYSCLSSLLFFEEILKNYKFLELEESYYLNEISFEEVLKNLI